MTTINLTINTKRGNDVQIEATLKTQYYPAEYDDFGQGMVKYIDDGIDWEMDQLECQFQHWPSNRWSYRKLDYNKMSQDNKAKIDKLIDRHLEMEGF
jgi:hypothetical protein